jgi:UDP-N-acetylmuramoyl-tripeptide--D-alanyl-D-alanine ligase
MIPLMLAEIADVVGGEVVDADPKLVVTGPAFLDSRSPEPGGLFVAFVGERVDGHEFAATAVDGGAAAVLASRPTGVPSVVVADTEAALQELARVVLSRLRPLPGHLPGHVPGHLPGDRLVVVAITGSQGKTSVKDMLAQLLADGAPTVATAGSFNNELGLPLTVLRTESSTRYLVLEMGARGIGHLRALCAVAPPDISLVLNVGRAHLGEFGSQENIAIAKGEIVEALPPDGVAVLNADDPLVAAMAQRTQARAFTYGRTGADVRLSAVGLDDQGGAAFDLTHDGVTEHVALRLLGEHQAANAAAAVAAALAAGRPFDRVVATLRTVDMLSRWRMEMRQRPDGLVVLNDAYNANPDSMRAALETLAAIGHSAGRTTVAVLGEMRELGDSSEAEHHDVGVIVRDLGIDRLYVVGEEARAIGDVHPDAVWFPTVEAVIDAVRENVVGTEVVLVKASRAAALERVAEALFADGAGEETGS